MPPTIGFAHSVAGVACSEDLEEASRSGKPDRSAMGQAQEGYARRFKCFGKDVQGSVRELQGFVKQFHAFVRHFLAFGRDCHGFVS